MEEKKRGSYGVVVRAEGREIDVGSPDDTGAQGWRYDAANHSIIIFAPADYTLTGSTSENQVLIQPDSQTSVPFQVILETIDMNLSGVGSPITIKGGAFVRILLDQYNNLYPPENKAGINVYYDSSLELDSLYMESYGSLYINGRGYAACIGANKGEAYGEITIKNVILNLNSGYYGSGIGYGDVTGGIAGSSGKITILGGNTEVSSYNHGNGISCKNLEINDGRFYSRSDISGITLTGSEGEEGEIIIGGNAEVDVTGGGYSPGIDCYISNGRGIITINGGVVTARGGYHAAGIGNGYYPWQSDSVITINGGVVSAYGGPGGAGIGSGYRQNVGKIEINGGIICAYGIGGGAGIGSGYLGEAKDITISSDASVIAESFNEYVDDIGTGIGMLNYTGLYSGIYSGELSGIYQGRLSGSFTGELARNYTKRVSCNISGEYNGMASGTYSGLFIGRFSGGLLPDSYSALFESRFARYLKIRD